MADVGLVFDTDGLHAQGEESAQTGSVVLPGTVLRQVG
jgi:hypothetical protein